MKKRKYYSGKFKTANFITNNKQVVKLFKECKYIDNYDKHKSLLEAELSVDWYEYSIECLAVDFASGEFIIELKNDAFKLLSEIGRYLNHIECCGIESDAYKALDWQ